MGPPDAMPTGAMPTDETSGQEKLRVLNLEDNPFDSELIQAQLDTAWQALEFLRVDTRAAFEQALDEFKPDVVLCDFNLPDINGREALNLMRQTHPDIPLIMVTGVLGDEQAAELIGLGARDYILKDRSARLAAAVQRALSEERGIRARKATEKAVRESEEKFRALFDSALDGIVLADAETKRLSSGNPVFCRMLGYSAEEINRLGVADIHPQQDLPRIIELFEKQVRDEIQPGLDIPVKRRDGSVFYVELNAAVITISGKKYLMGVFHDITERKQMDEKLRASEAFKSSMIENSNDCIKVLSREGLLKYMATSGQRLLEIEDINKYLDKSWIDFWNGEDREAARLAVSAAARGEIGHFHGYSPTEKGMPKWWDVIITPIRETNGTINTLLAVSRDITERKQAETQVNEQLTELHRWYEATLGIGTRNIELKREVNELLGQAGQPPRYLSVAAEGSLHSSGALERFSHPQGDPTGGVNSAPASAGSGLPTFGVPLAGEQSNAE